MKEKKVRKELAKKYNRDVRVIEAVTKHPFKFLKDVIEDKHDPYPVRIQYLGAFVQKTKMNKAKYYSNTVARKILKRQL